MKPKSNLLPTLLLIALAIVAASAFLQSNLWMPFSGSRYGLICPSGWQNGLDCYTMPITEPSHKKP